MLGLDKQSRLNRRLNKAVLNDDVAAAKLALDQGAELEKRGHFGLTPLGTAAVQGKPNVARLLLDRGANIEARDNDQETPLVNACRFGRPTTALLLIERGADAKAEGKFGRNPLSYATAKRLTAVIAKLDPPVVVAAPAPPPPRVENPDEVVIFRTRGNRLLEESFNFASRERITLLRSSMDGPVEAMTRDSFSAIDDKQQLRYAFGLYKQQGGKLAEEDVFPDSLGKKPLPGRQP